jgi:hypothetical protein
MPRTTSFTHSITNSLYLYACVKVLRVPRDTRQCALHSSVAAVRARALTRSHAVGVAARGTRSALQVHPPLPSPLQEDHLRLQVCVSV